MLKLLHMNITKTTPKDFFLHLGATVALYISTIALINLAYSIINYHFPDALAGYFSSSSIAWPISILIVLIPVLYVIEWFIKKDSINNPEKNDIWIKKWRIYLTLFLTAAVIAGDLIVLINTYLNGEISSRFVCKFFVILIVLAVIFAYYLLEKLNRSLKTKTILAYVGLILTIVTIVFGFLVVGTPSKQRALKFDNQRVSDLQNIQWQIITYWQQNGKLPIALNSLNDQISGYTIPTDPETLKSYEYSVLDTTKFELCSTFSQPYKDMSGKGNYNSIVGTTYYSGTLDGNWKHDVGRTCFQRTIDSQRYPVNITK